MRLKSYKIHAQPYIHEEQEPNRLSMNWNEINHLSSLGHTIGCHGYKHVRLSSALTGEQLQMEIQQSRVKIQDKTSQNIDVFCWIGGEFSSYSKAASDLIRVSGYEIGLMTCCQPVRSSSKKLNWHRFNVEGDFPIQQVRLILGGMYTLMYKRKYKNVEKITSL